MNDKQSRRGCRTSRQNSGGHRTTSMPTRHGGSALKNTTLTVTSSRQDFHLQVDAHAGRTKKKDRLAQAV